MNKEIISIMWHDFIRYLRYTEPFHTLREWYYNTRNFLFCRYDLIRTGMPKTQWCDKSELMLYGMMIMLKDYVEKEKCFEMIEWTSTDQHKCAAEEIHTIYAWWLNYETRQKEISDALMKWHDAKFEGVRDGEWLRRINTEDTPEIKLLFDHLHDLENKLIEEEQEMLIRLVKIRQFLWV